MHLGLVAGVIARMGTEEQKQRWLPQMATGEVLACFGLTEPDHGSDAGNLTGTAVKQDDGSYRINTRKIFITNGTIAGLALVMARTGGEGSRGVSAFLVPTDTPGFTANPIHGKLGLRSCDTAELVLDDVVVGAGRAARRGRGHRHQGRAVGARRRPHVDRRELHRHHPGLPRLDGRVHDAARAVRQEDRRAPARAGADRRHRGACSTPRG